MTPLRLIYSSNPRIILSWNNYWYCASFNNVHTVISSMSIHFFSFANRNTKGRSTMFWNDNIDSGVMKLWAVASEKGRESEWAVAHCSTAVSRLKEKHKMTQVSFVSSFFLLEAWSMCAVSLWFSSFDNTYIFLHIKKCIRLPLGKDAAREPWQICQCIEWKRGWPSSITQWQ